MQRYLPSFDHSSHRQPSSALSLTRVKLSKSHRAHSCIIRALPLFHAFRIPDEEPCKTGHSDKLCILPVSPICLLFTQNLTPSLAMIRPFRTYVMCNADCVPFLLPCASHQCSQRHSFMHRILHPLVRHFAHRFQTIMQRLSDLAWRHIHDVGISKLVPFPLCLEGLNAVIETRV